MDSKLVLVVAIGVITTMIGHSDAIHCYSCQSIFNNSCLDPFKSGGVQTCSGETCTKIWTTNSGVTTVVRDCQLIPDTSDKCFDITVNGAHGRSCHCRTHYCNDGGMLRATSYFVVIAVAMVIFMPIAWITQN